MCFAFQTTSPPRTPPNLMPPDLMPLQDLIRREAAKKNESRITKTTIFGLPDGFFPHHGCTGIASVTFRNTQIACCEQIVALSHLHHCLWSATLNPLVFVAKKIDWWSGELDTVEHHRNVPGNPRESGIRRRIRPIRVGASGY